MKRIALYILAFLPMAAFAAGQHELRSTDTENCQSVELRQEASFSYDLPKNFDISLSEELRSVVMDKSVHSTDGAVDNGAYFYKLYSTLELGYKPLSIQSMQTGYKYGLKFHAGYTLRFLANKDLSDAKSCLQHRPFVGMTGSVDFGPVKLSLRERYLVDIRLDSVSVVDKWNPEIVVLEKNPVKMELRSRLRADFLVPGKPIKPFTWIELNNTLNEPSCPWTDSEGKPLYGGQYLNGVRACAGIKWRIDAHNALSFSYVFAYLKDRDINITRNAQHVELTNVTTLRHSITIAYDLGY